MGKARDRLHEALWNWLPSPEDAPRDSPSVDDADRLIDDAIEEALQEKQAAESKTLAQAREELLSIGSQDMPVSGAEVQQAIAAFENALWKEKG